MSEDRDKRIKLVIDAGEAGEVEEFSLSSDADTDERNSPGENVVGEEPQVLPVITQKELGVIYREMDARVDELRGWLMHNGTGDKVAHGLVLERMLEVQHITARLGAMVGGE